MMTPPPSSSPHPSPQYEDEVLKKRIILPNSQKSAIIITINRPDRLNCFNTEVCHKLAQTFYDVAEEIQRNDINVGENEHADQNNNISAVIFTGQGPSFCAGADLSDPPNPLAQSSDLPHHLRWNPVYQMTRVGVPIIGALKGHVSEFYLLCDVSLTATLKHFLKKIK